MLVQRRRPLVFGSTEEPVALPEAADRPLGPEEEETGAIKNKWSNERLYPIYMSLTAVYPQVGHDILGRSRLS